MSAGCQVLLRSGLVIVMADYCTNVRKKIRQGPMSLPCRVLPSKATNAAFGMSSLK